MAVDVVLTVTAVTLATKTADLISAGASVNAAETFSIANPGGSLARDILVFMEEEGTGAATVTFDAGDNPPAELAGLGALDVVLANADLRLVVLESARHAQNDGLITGSVATNDVLIYVLQLPHTY